MVVCGLPEETNKSSKSNTAAPKYLFQVRENIDKLGESMKKEFHSTVAKLLWVAYRTRPDILTAIGFLTTRVQSPDTDDWKKLRNE